MSQARIFALRTTVVEIKKLEPCLQNIFLFQKDGQVIAKDDQTRDEQVRALADFFGALLNRAENVDALTDLSLAGSKSTLNVCCIGDLYAGTVFSRETDQKTVKALTKITLPTIIKLVDQIAPITQLPVSQELPQENSTPQPVQDSVSLPKVPVNQFIVEKIGGLLTPQDTVRVDSITVEGWFNLYSNQEIREVNLESISGKITRCKFKSNKNQKQLSGTILVPEKIMSALKVGRGELVMVAPVVELEAQM
ncbi:MAG: hypothetical protein NWF01_06390 [Candidatus Bathyarchaeota archaeon]|nr:hypothetical protein [Candidatus Bathyarchaeota archaeon]